MGISAPSENSLEELMLSLVLGQKFVQNTLKSES